MQQQLLLATLLFGTLIASAAAGMQSTAAAGTLSCGGRPIGFVRIELWDKDTLDPDDLMANTTSSSDGGFFIQGKESEITTIDPEVRIFHKCGDSSAKCFKQVTIKIPDQYVTATEKPEKMFQMQTINLDTAPSTQSNICNSSGNSRVPKVWNPMD